MKTERCMNASVRNKLTLIITITFSILKKISTWPYKLSICLTETRTYNKLNNRRDCLYS